MMGMFKNADLLQGSLVNKEVEMSKLKSKAYGYDINKKLEYQQQRLKPYGNAIHIDDDNLWESDGRVVGGSIKLDQLSKEKQLWIGNPSQNIDKLVNDMDKNYKANEEINVNSNYGQGGNYYNNNINSNLRKYSPLILDQSKNNNHYSYKNKY
jgi:hypothetical protein